MMDEVFLRPETTLEPLSCGWYAWTHLIPPAQRAMNLAYRQVPLLRSYLQNPAIHLAASRDRTLFGGPFVHLPPEYIGQVRGLLDETTIRCNKLLTFAREYKQFDEQVQAGATGHSLNELYERIPPALAGLVEILYDLNNHPKLRMLEELVYSEYFDPALYEIMLSDIREDERPFFMTTPRFADRNSIVFPMPLSDTRVDLLSSMRTRAASLREVTLALQPPAERVESFRQFFTSSAPDRKAPDYHGSAVRMRYFGHACVLLQTAQTAVLCDPMFASRPDAKDGRFTFADLPDRIDYVVISHGHQDHCTPEMLIQLRHRIGTVIIPANNAGNLADPSLKLMLEHLGIRRLQVVASFDEIPIPGGMITSLPFPGEHVDLDIHTRQGIYVELKGRRFAFLVDSDCRDPALFRRIGRHIGASFDALFLGMECHGAPLTWLYGPLLTKQITRRDDESRRLSGLNCARARGVLGELSAARVFIYAMGQEPWLKHIMGLEYSPDSIQLKEVAALLEYCKAVGISATSLFASHEAEF